MSCTSSCTSSECPFIPPPVPARAARYAARLASLLACLSVCFACAAFVGCSNKGDADEEEAEEKVIDVSKVPATAMASIKKESGDATVKRVLVGQKRGKPYYEAKYNDKSGKRMMTQVAEDGKVFKTIEDDDPEPK